MCAEICRAAGFSATFFCTHRTDILDDLRQSSLFELGIHPSLGPGSTHGRSDRETLEHCLSIVPDAKTMRTHGLVQSTALFRTVTTEFPSIEYDVSLFLPFHPNLQISTFHFGSKRLIHRLPYFWEDDVASLSPDWKWGGSVPANNGLRIFDFHPIHVALNMSSLGQYAALKEKHEGRPLWSLSPSEVGAFSRSGEGTRTFLERLALEENSKDYGKIVDLGALNLRKTRLS